MANVLDGDNKGGVVSPRRTLYHVVVVRRFPGGHLRAGERFDGTEVRLTASPVALDAAQIIASKHTPRRTARFWTNAEPMVVRREEA